ncbi:hypothetical protein V6N13_085390 [Hibiscus sabdariffa]|uniref:Uncharacterized protein n=1 Tax=Hibiscus sabdariffa TaxID=183260 RepID=A0ABR2D1E4_9ROSI
MSGGGAIAAVFGVVFFILFWYVLVIKCAEKKAGKNEKEGAKKEKEEGDVVESVVEVLEAAKDMAEAVAEIDGEQVEVGVEICFQQQQQQTSNTPVYTASHAQSVQNAYANPRQTPQHSGNRAPQAHYTVLGSNGVSSRNVVYYSAPVTHHVSVSQLSPQTQFVPVIAHSA